LKYIGLLIGFPVLVALFSSACTDTKSSPKSLLPASYRTNYTMVRDCRKSGDHDFNYVRVFADPAATDPYLMRTTEFPADSVVVKEEYDPADVTCGGEIQQWTLMSRLATGTAPTTIDWSWQKVMKDGTVTEDDRGCIGCHKLCGVPPDGYQGTCSIP
jgi:hypothetical protein